MYGKDRTAIVLPAESSPTGDAEWTYCGIDAPNGTHTVRPVSVFLLILSTLLGLGDIMELAMDYIATLQDSRAHEEARRVRRRRRRHDYIAGVQRDRQKDNTLALERDVLRRADTCTVMEKRLFTTLRRTACWWDMLCEQSIEHRLKCELAEKKKTAYLRAYISNTLEREQSELQNVLTSDSRRWELTKQLFESEERKLREEAVCESIQDIQDSADRCIQFLIDYCIEDSQSSILAQFALAEVVRGDKSATPHPSVSAQGAFKRIFGGNPFTISSPTFLELLRMLFRRCNVGNTLSNLLFDVCPVPIFAVDGPKFSGKSVVAACLVEQFGLECCSDRSLVERALAANADSTSASAEHPAGELKSDANFSASGPELETTGKREAGPEEEVTASTEEGTATEVEATPASEQDGTPTSEQGLRSPSETTDFFRSEQPTPPALQESSVLAEVASHPATDPFLDAVTPPAEVPAELEKQELQKEWAAFGAQIQESLLEGDPVPDKIIAGLFALRAKEVKLTEEVAGVIFDGVIHNAEICKELQNLLLPSNSDPFLELMHRWCPMPTPAPVRTAEEDIALKECIPPDLQMPVVVVEETTTRREVRRRSVKKAGQPDKSVIAPVVLPVIEDNSEEIRKEKVFILEAQRELATYAGLFTALLHIECSPEEIFRRFAGLRLDTQTGYEYHMIYDPPPPDRVPFLVSLDRTTTYTAQLSDVVFRQEQDWAELAHWMHTHPSMVTCVRQIPGCGAVQEMQLEAFEIITEASNNFFAGKALYEAMRASEKRVQELEATHREQVAAREVERVRLAALHTEKNIPLPPELEAPPKMGNSEEVVPEGLPELILGELETLTSTYVSLYDWAWSRMSGVAKLLLEYRIKSQSQLHKYWESPDNKQVILDRYIHNYNATPAILRCKPACKEEMHFIVDELAEALFSSVDARKRECAGLIDTLTRREVILEGWEACVCNIGHTMAHAEASRFVTVANIVLFYFSSILEEPCMFEDVDFDTSHAPIPQAAADAFVESARGSNMSSSKRQPTTGAKKGHAAGKNPDETNERAMQDAFKEITQRISHTLTGFVDKVRVSCDASSKTQKKVVAANAPRLMAIANRCLPIFESELQKTIERLGYVRDYICELIHQGEAYREKIRQEMHNEARETLQAQAASVNSAIYILRSRIEEELPAPMMHLGYGTFSVLGEYEGAPAAASPQHQPSFLTDVPLYQDLLGCSVLVHASLTAGRLLELISTFRCLAPNFQLPRDDFVLVVREEDYVAEESTTTTPKIPSEVFRSFDRADVGVIDWREFIVHLLFWCSPPPLKNQQNSWYLPEVSMETLQYLKKELLSVDELTIETFNSLPLHYKPFITEKACEVYTFALWQLFYDHTAKCFDVRAFLWFLCSDIQPIRGAQKAFFVLSSSCDGTMNKEELEDILHVHAANPRTIGRYDPFSKQNIHLLFQDAETMSFAQMCGCALGRYMLNSVSVFHRKTFTQKDI